MERYDVRLINFNGALVGSYRTIGEAQDRAHDVGFEAAIYDKDGMFVTSCSPIYGPRSMDVMEAIRLGDRA